MKIKTLIMDEQDEIESLRAQLAIVTDERDKAWKDTQRMSARVIAAEAEIERLKEPSGMREMLLPMFDSERLRFIEALGFCRHCGSDEKRFGSCQCWNDE